MSVHDQPAEAGAPLDGLEFGAGAGEFSGTGESSGTADPVQIDIGTGVAPAIGGDVGDMQAAAADESVGGGSAGDDDAGQGDGETPEEAGDDLERVTRERDAYLVDLQRVTADFANFRKQNTKRNTELVARASARLVEALLPVLDALDAAESQGAAGMAPIRSQLLGVLEQEGLEVISAVDETFDPNRHEAVLTEESEAPGQSDGPVVAEVLRTGYAWKGRVFRPAMVKVRG